MILRNATIKYKGYDLDLLKPKSHKRICCSCDNCGRVRWVEFGAYRDLCKSCSKNGKFNPNYNKSSSKETREKISIATKDENNPMYGKHHTNETKKLMSNIRIGKYIGKDAPMWNKKHSDKTRQKMKENHADFSKENHPQWKGDITHKRDHVLPINKCLHINQRFDDSHAHHVSSDIVIFIPKELHYHIYHNLKDGNGMYEMNLLALQYLKGEL